MLGHQGLRNIILMMFGDSKQKTQIESIFLAEDCGNASMGCAKSCRMKKAASNYCLFKENILNLKCYRTNLKCYRNEVHRQHFPSMHLNNFKRMFCLLLLISWSGSKGLGRVWHLQNGDFASDSFPEKLNGLWRINYSLIRVVLLKWHSSSPATHFPSH